MKEDILSLIKHISVENSTESQKCFNDIVKNKIEDQIKIMRSDITKNMFYEISKQGK